MDPDPSSVREALVAREPLCHRRELVYSAETFDAETADDFWEIGASGRRYTRAFVKQVVLQRLAETDDDDMVTQGWHTEDHRVRRLGPSTFLLTYLLREPTRTTRRATVWRYGDDRGWHALYHQGTVVVPE